jgi:subtilisin family serine protease
MKMPLFLLSCLSLMAQPRTVDTDFIGAPGGKSILLVRHKGNASEVAEFHRQQGARVKRFKHANWHAIDMPKGEPGERLYRNYRNSRLFDRVQFDEVYEIVAVPNDPLYARQWALAKIEAAAAWDRATTNNVVVAVIDTGIDFNHPDLRDNLWTGPSGEHGYTARNGIITAGGYDDHYHGTHVAGTIAAIGNNGQGIAGINWRMKLISFKFLTASGSGFSSDAGLCIDRMIDLKQSGVNLRVSNHSWGGIGRDDFLEDMFQAASQAGILNVCAAGNNNLDTDEYTFSPASLPVDGIVSVVASQQSDTKAFFSNYGITTTDVMAPGVAILSCRPGGSYWELSGTSMASPHVAGAAAMLFSLNPSLAVEEAKTILLQPESCDQTGFTATSTGGGRLNMRKLWNNPGITDPPPVNHSPTLRLDTPTNFLVVLPGVPVTVTATATDPDNDPISYITSATALRDNWLPELWWERPHFAFSGETNRHTVSTLDLALDQKVSMQFGATDSRGGGARVRQTVWSFRNERKVRDIASAILGFRVWLDAQNRFWYRLDVDSNQVPTHRALYSIEVRPQSSPWSDCCAEPNRDVPTEIKFPQAGDYAVRPFLMDMDGNFATGPQAHVVVSNSALRAPLARLNLNTRRGRVPLQIVGDLSASVKNSVARMHFGTRMWNQTGITFNTDIFNPVRRLTLTEPGVYEIGFYCADMDSPMEDMIVEFITALPAQPVMLSMEQNPLRLRVLSEPGLTIQVEASTDLRTWSHFDTVENPGGNTVLTIVGGTQRFFRAFSE